MIDYPAVEAALKAAPWTFAKTMPYIPHEYPRLKQWPDKELWFEVVRYIWANGYKEKFGRRWYTYLNAGGYKHWTMDPTVESTDLINRAKL